jgi:hypothetical protein
MLSENNKKKKSNHPLTKPKRPMSACEFISPGGNDYIVVRECFMPPLINRFFCNSAVDNYYFQRERNKILNSEDDDGSKKSFQEIGRLIGQRWREIKPEEVRHIISLTVIFDNLLT